MSILDLFGIEQFLHDYPGMSLGPFHGEELVLKGEFAFSATPHNGSEITDSYSIEISIPKEFPNAVPTVTETSRKIPREGDYHINPDDTLCLGSPLRLLIEIRKNPDLVGFAENCLVPYLYSVSYKLENGGGFYIGELSHGRQGIIDDYLELFGLHNEKQIIRALQLLGMKRKLANKKPCPCGCGRRLGRCSFRNKLNKFRAIAPRHWFLNHLEKELM